MRRKVTVVGGAGNVGSTVARCIADKNLADVVIVDIADQKAAGIALDMLESCPIIGSDSRVIGGSDYAQTANSDVVVVTSGVPRKPGMSRDDLLNVNFGIMKAVTEQVVKYSPNCIIVPVANPLDAMAQAVYRLSKFPARAGDRHGRRARFGADAGVHRDGAERLGREHPRLRPGRPRRHDGAAAALLDGRRRAHHRADVEGTRGGDLQAHRRRRRRDHQAGRDERVVRAGRGSRRDGGVHPARQEEDPAVLGVPAGRVRHPRSLRRRARRSSARAASKTSSRSS